MTYYANHVQIAALLGRFWSEIAGSEEFVKGFQSIMELFTTNTQQRLDLIQACMSRQAAKATVPVNLKLFRLQGKDRVATTTVYKWSELTQGEGQILYGAPAGVPVWLYPFTGEVTPQWLCPSVLNPAAVLQRNVDFVIDTDNGMLVFYQDPETLTGVTRLPVSGPDHLPVLDIPLWGFGNQEDMQMVQSFWGWAAGVSDCSTPELLSAVNLALDLKMFGLTDELLARTLSFITDTDPIERDGVVKKVFKEGGRLCILTDNAIYTAPGSATTDLRPGDSVTRTQPAFDTWTVYPATAPVPPEAFPAVYLSGGCVLPAIKAGLLFRNSTVLTTLDRLGNPLLQPDGLAADVATFNAQLLELREEGKGLLHDLTVKYGTVPAACNLFDELRELYYSHNGIFVRFCTRVDNPGLAGKLLKVLHNTLPAGSVFFFLEEAAPGADVVSLTTMVEETITPFHVQEATDTGIEFNDRLTYGTTQGAL